MNYKLSNLANNLPVLTIPIPALSSATVAVWVKTGSRWETPALAGISHFLEHMAFKGGKKYKNALEVSEAVDAIGGEFNAGTSKEWTTFYIRAGAKHLETMFDVLSDMLLSPRLNENDIKREKGVIVEEIGLYEDTPIYKIGDVFENILFAGHSLGRDIIGTRKTVRSLTRNDIKRYITKHYVAGQMMITVAGGVEQKTVNSLAKKYFSSLKSKKDTRKLSKFIYKNKKPQLKVIYKKLDQAHVNLGFPSYKKGHKDRYALKVLAAILGGGMSSRLFTEIREKRGLAYSVHTAQDSAEDTGAFVTYAGVDPKKADEAIRVMIDEHLKLTKDEVGEKELAKAKEFIKGHISLSLENTRAVGSFFALEKMLTGQMIKPEDVFRGIDQVTTKDVKRVAKAVFVRDNVNLAVIGPYKTVPCLRKF